MSNEPRKLPVVEFSRIRNLPLVFKADADAIIAALTKERDALRSALEHTLHNWKLSVSGRPVRDMAETLAEAVAALNDKPA